MEEQKIYELMLSVLSNEATDEECQLLTDWLNESEANRAEYEKIEQLHRACLSPSKEYIFQVEKAWEQVCKQTIRKKKGFTLSRVLRYAALIAFVLGAGLLYYITQRETEQPITAHFEEPTLLLENGDPIALNEKSFSRQEKQVVIKNEAHNQLVYESEHPQQPDAVKINRLIIPKGKTYQVVLADGTKIRLNSETELSYPTQFSSDKREVTLSGEAFFEVTHDETKPFYVKTNGVEVKVLGTVFNVSCYANDAIARTTLVEGSVSVQPDKGFARIIKPSEQFAFNKQTGGTDIQIVDTQSYTSWINGRYIFKDVPLDKIITKLQRWFDFTVSYQDESLKRRHFTLIADRKTNLDQLLEVVSYTSDIKLERKGTSIHIQKKEGKIMP